MLLKPSNCKHSAYSKYLYRIMHLKKELLNDITLNKEFVRNYEIAARRLESILMQKMSHENIKDFEKILKEEVKDFIN